MSGRLRIAPITRVKGETWNRPSRPREDKLAIVDKWRWVA